MIEVSPTVHLGCEANVTSTENYITTFCEHPYFRNTFLFGYVDGTVRMIRFELVGEEKDVESGNPRLKPVRENVMMMVNDNGQ